MAIDRDKVLTNAQKFVEKRKYDKAIAEYQKIIQEDPNDARILLKIGDLQSRLEAYVEAVATYDRVARLYAQQGFALKAIAVFKQIKEMLGKHVPQLEDRYAHVAPKLAELYQQLGMTSDALATWDEVGTRLQRQGNDAAAIEIFRKIVELDSLNWLTRLRLAEALSRAKDIEGAVVEFAAASAQLVRLNRRDEALKVIERLLHHKADATHARIAAELYLARGQSNDGLQALAKLQICFQANPKDLDTLSLLARAFHAIGQAAKAIEVQKEMARLAKEQGKIELFKQLVERLARLAPNDDVVRRLIQGSEEPPPMRPHAPSSVSVVTAEDLSESQTTDDMPPPRAPDPASQIESIPPDELIEIESTGSEIDPHERLLGLLKEADRARGRGDFAHGIDLMVAAVEMAPRSLEAHEQLRDLLIESGRAREGLGVMLALARLQIDALDGESAARTLQDVLALDPANARAAELLSVIGYEYVDDAPDVQMRESFLDVPDLPDADPEANAPLPSYDLEEVSLDQVGTAYSERSIPAARVALVPSIGGDSSDLDDPFGEKLPAFPLEQTGAPPDVEHLGHPYAAEPTSAHLDEPYAVEAVSTHTATAEAEIDEPFDLVGEPERAAFDDHTHPEEELFQDPPANQRVAPYTIPAGAPDPGGEDAAQPPRRVSGRPERVSQSPSADLEAALEEADFFAATGLIDDARATIEEQLSRWPNHPLLLEKLNELCTMQADLGSEPEPARPPRAHEASDAAFVEEADRSFDIATALGALDEARPARPPQQSLSDDVDIEEVFAKFKEGVAKQISVDDAQSHYDLGVAYKEMGLLPDAIRELQTAARDPSRECLSYSTIGQIEVERGNVSEALVAFYRALQAKTRTREQQLDLEFELGILHQSQRAYRDALSHFRNVAALQPGYRDVERYIDRLSEADPSARRGAKY